MKYLILVFTLFSLKCESLPIPTGQIIKYRVSSKYFNRPSESSDNSLYQLLSEIHYGMKESPSTPVSEEVTTFASESLPEDVSNDVDVTTQLNSIANEYPETTDLSDDVPAKTEQPILSDTMKVNSDNSDEGNNNDNIETDLIEKVGDEKDDLVTTEAAANTNDDLMKDEHEEEESSSISTIEMTTISDDSEIEKIETNSNAEENESKVPESLLSAVGDLLSSVLGLSAIDDEVTENVEYQEESEITSEQSTLVESTVKNLDEEISQASMDIDEDVNQTSELTSAVSDVDLKIQNLANGETSFVTENIPDVYVENFDDSVKEQEQEQPEPVQEAISEQTESDVKDESDDDKIVLETLSELSTINSHDDEELVSFEDSVNHVMNLVRGTEGKLALEAAQNVVDSVLIDRHMEDSVDDLDQIVYGTLKEIGTGLGLNEEDDKIQTADTFEPVNNNGEREELIKNFEADINESLRFRNPEEYEILELEPKPAKAMYYKFQYGDDF